jgi:hypothetical protein
MAKIIVAVLMSSQEHYLLMKELWIQNIISTNDNEISLYFLCDSDGIPEKELETINHKNIFNFYTNTKNLSMYVNMITKSLNFFEYLKRNSYFGTHYVLRTNASTMFNFKMMQNWIQMIPKENFLGGSFISNFSGINTILSGTNLLFTPDILNILLDNKQKLNMNLIDDVCFTSFLIHYIKGLKIINIKRLDFIENVLYHKCHIGDKDIFCFRFCSKDRYDDLLYMSNLLNNNFELNIEKILNYSKKQITTEFPEYGEMYSKKVFSVV